MRGTAWLIQQPPHPPSLLPPSSFHSPPSSLLLLLSSLLPPPSSLHSPPPFFPPTLSSLLCLPLPSLVPPLSLLPCSTHFLPPSALEQDVECCLSSLRLHDFLWREDRHATYETFLETSPSHSDCCLNVERFMEVEEKVSTAAYLPACLSACLPPCLPACLSVGRQCDGSLMPQLLPPLQLSEVPEVFEVGPLHILSGPVTHSLSALAVAWKLEFASFLHKQAQVSQTIMQPDSHAPRPSCTQTIMQPDRHAPRQSCRHSF